MYPPRSSLRLSSGLMLAFLCTSLSSFSQTVYERWLDEEVGPIITVQERAAFASLTIDRQRDDFVKLFWERRDPTPATVANEFKTEHYRRLAYANQNFAEGRAPGWKSDRGQTFVVQGAPDKIDRFPSGAIGAHQFGEMGHRYEIWHYSRSLNPEITVKFTDDCDCGELKRDK